MEWRVCSEYARDDRIISKSGWRFLLESAGILLYSNLALMPQFDLHATPNCRIVYKLAREPHIAPALDVFETVKSSSPCSDAESSASSASSSNVTMLSQPISRAASAAVP